VTALWIHEIVDRFWSEAGEAPATFPRDLAGLVGWVLPVKGVEHVFAGADLDVRHAAVSNRRPAVLAVQVERLRPERGGPGLAGTRPADDQRAQVAGLVEVVLVAGGLDLQRHQSSTSIRSSWVCSMSSTRSSEAL
jgi:hypothetical protein